MKTKIFSLTLAAAAALGTLSGCSDDWTPEGVKEEGKLSIASLGVEVDGAETVVNDGPSKAPLNVAARAASNAPTVHVDNFLVDIIDANGATVNSWTYSEIDNTPVVLPVGSYTVNVRSHNVEPAAWDAPYYEGSQTFAIKSGIVTEVGTVVCSLANIRVSVTFAQSLLDAIDTPSEATVKVTSEGNSQLVFTPSETRNGYFAALKDLETLRLDFSASINGHVETFTKTLDNVAKGQHRKITLSLTSNPNLPPEEYGTITDDGTGIKVDSEVIEDEPIRSDFDWFEDNLDGQDRPGGEDFDDNQGGNEGGEQGGDDPTPPAGNAISFSSTSLDLEGMNYAADFPMDGSKPAAVEISAENGIANLLVEIISNSLTDEMLKGLEPPLAATFDLAYPGSLEGALSNPDGFNFPTGDKVIGHTSVTFNIAPFVPMLNIYTGEIHKFKITVTDQKGNVKSITLQFQA